MRVHMRTALGLEVVLVMPKIIKCVRDGFLSLKWKFKLIVSVSFDKWTSNKGKLRLNNIFLVFQSFSFQCKWTVYIYIKGHSHHAKSKGKAKAKLFQNGICGDALNTLLKFFLVFISFKIVLP